MAGETNAATSAATLHRRCAHSLPNRFGPPNLGLSCTLITYTIVKVNLFFFFSQTLQSCCFSTKCELHCRHIREAMLLQQRQTHMLLQLDWITRQKRHRPQSLLKQFSHSPHLRRARSLLTSTSPGARVTTRSQRRSIHGFCSRFSPPHFGISCHVERCSFKVCARWTGNWLSNPCSSCMNANNTNIMLQ